MPRAGPLLVAAALACSAEAPPPATLRLAEATARGRLAGPIAFDGGGTLRGVILPAAPLAPGAEVEVAWQTEGGERLTLEVGLVPPRVAARQEVRYGSEAAAARELPEQPPSADPRARWVEVPAARQAATLALPEDYFPRQAVVLARGRRGGVPVRAITGPRREDGTAVLGVVDVRPTPRHVRIPRAAAPPALDGVLDDPIWQGPGVALVESLEGEPAPATYATRVRFAWDDRALYVAADLPDPDVWGTLTARDDKLWEEEAFEVFLAADGSGRDYLELQVSPRGTRFDARFARHRQGEPAWDGDWQAAVHVAGTIDARGDRDEGWSVEVAVPWSTLCAKTRIPCPPRVGLRLRGNVFRLERPRKGSTVALALSPTRRPDFHTWNSAATLELAP